MTVRGTARPSAPSRIGRTPERRLLVPVLPPRNFAGAIPVGRARHRTASSHRRSADLDSASPRIDPGVAIPPSREGARPYPEPPLAPLDPGAAFAVAFSAAAAAPETAATPPLARPRPIVLPAGPAFPPPGPRDPVLERWTTWAYRSFGLGFLLPVAPLVGVVAAIALRRRARGTHYESHLRGLLKVFGVGTAVVAANAAYLLLADLSGPAWLGWLLVLGTPSCLAAAGLWFGRWMRGKELLRAALPCHGWLPPLPPGRP